MLASLAEVTMFHDTILHIEWIACELNFHASAHAILPGRCSTVAYWSIFSHDRWLCISHCCGENLEQFAIRSDIFTMFAAFRLFHVADRKVTALPSALFKSNFMPLYCFRTGSHHWQSLCSRVTRTSLTCWWNTVRRGVFVCRLCT